jgi:putative SOS response-associated peptidase YedK
MVRATARSKVIGHSYRDFGSLAQQGGDFSGQSASADTLDVMCGRYASSASPQDLMEEFEVDDLFEGLPGPDYNVAPTVQVPAIFERRVKDTGEVRRRLAPLVWGLVPSWAKDPSIGSRMINARLETVAEKPAFKRAFSARRCILPADGFYEWYAAEQPAATVGRGRGKPKKQPFFIHRADGGRLVMAGIYEIWRDPQKDPGDDTAWLRTCSVITTQATDAAGHIHDRMPMVISRGAISDWLDPTITDSEHALELLAVTEAQALEAYAVSTDVNSVENNNSALLEPVTAEPEQRDDQETLI